MDLGQIAIVVGLLLACLVAVLLVQLARRDSAAQREQATRDVASIREDARAAVVDIERREERLAARERALADDQRDAVDEARALRDRALGLAQSERRMGEQVVADRLAAIGELENLSGLSASEARAELERRLVEQATQNAEAAVRRVEAKARQTGEDRARRIVATAVQRVAVPTSSQSVVAVVHLPSEEMKGRIIGKEGRNIRLFEALTGVNVLIDDTPDSVMLSCFDAERREVAQVALESLIADGRIHPQRIESAYATAVA